VNTALYPSLARAAVSAPAALARTYERVLRYLIIISFPIAVGGCVLADQLIPFLFGDEFLPAIPALQIVIWVVPLMFVSEFLGYMVVLANRERQVARAVLVSTGLNVILNLALVPWLGLMAAAIMTVLTEAVLVTQHAWTLRTPLRQMRWTTALVRPALAALAMGGLVVLADPYLPLLGKVALGAVSYAGLLLLLGVIGSDEVGFVRGLAARRPASGVPGGSD
jgi:O-antigen/teichoic acid export membrane protein